MRRGSFESSGESQDKNIGFFDRRFWIGAFLGAFVVGVSMIFIGSKSGKTDNAPTANSIPTKSAERMQPRQWAGNGTKTTESFRISQKSWKICWETQIDQSIGVGVFQVYVYRESGALVTIAANTMYSDTDCSIVHESGTFYIQVNSTQRWQLRIE